MGAVAAAPLCARPDRRRGLIRRIYRDRDAPDVDEAPIRHRRVKSQAQHNAVKSFSSSYRIVPRVTPTTPARADVTKKGRPIAPRFDPNVKSVAYNVGATTLMSAFSALRSADSWPCGTPSDVPMFTMRADVACDRPAPRAMGPSAE